MRRSFLILLCLASLTGCSTLKGLLPAKDTSEPPAPLVEFAHQVEIDVIWSRDVGAGSKDDHFELVPALDIGRVFAADIKGRVKAFDSASGEPLWETQLKTPVSGGTGAGDGLVLLGTTEGEVIALGQDSGEERWRIHVSSEILSPPAASSGVVVVRTVDGNLFGLNSSTGQRVWSYDRAVPVLTLRGTAAPVIQGDIVLSGFDNGRLAAISLIHGRPLWESRITLPSGRTEIERMVDIDAEPIVVGDAVYAVTYQGRVAALDLGTGRTIWRRDMSSYAGIGADAGNLYVTDDMSHVWALDRYSSASLWRQTKLQARMVTAPVRHQDYVVVGDGLGYLHLMHHEDGRFVGRTRIDSAGIAVPPIIGDDTIYVLGKGGDLAALQLR